MSGLKEVLAAHQYDYPDSFCACGTYVGGSPWVDHPAHVAAAIREWLLSEAVVERVGEALTAQLACYTLPANYSAPYRPETHDDVARRCGPLNARAVLTAATEEDRP